MSVRQDRFTFFGVLVAVVIVVLGYLQLGQLYPVVGRDAPEVQPVDEQPDENADPEEEHSPEPAERVEDASGQG